MKRDVFISYSHHDKAIADSICDHLENKGITCWYAPRDIIPGADWANSIMEAINKVKIMVVVFTDQSNISRQVQNEISNAFNQELIIIPFKLTKSKPSQSFQYYFTSVHWLDAADKPLDDGISELGSLVYTILHSSKQKDKPAKELTGNHEMSKAGQSKFAPKRQLLNKRILAMLITASVLIIVGIITYLIIQSNSNQKLLQQIFEGKIEITGTETDAFSMKLQVKNPENSFYSNSWYDTVEANEDDTVQFKITYTNQSGQLQKDVVIRLISSEYMEYVPGTTVLYNSNYKEGLALSNDFLTQGDINIGQYDKNASAVVTFEAKVKNDLPRGGVNVLREWVQIYVGDTFVQDNADVHIKKE